MNTRADNKLPIYLDHAASTPIDADVRRALDAAYASPLGVGNPSATTHVFGKRAAAAIEHAREQLAALVGAASAELIFTSGATESDNLALLGVARARASFGRHVVISKIEHKAVLDPARQLEKQGWQVTRLEPERDGRIDPQAVAAALRPETQLVSIMHANNEVGVVQDIPAIAAVCRARGVLLHSDAAQTVGKLPVDVGTLGVDLLSFTAHKFYGPKGVGALYVSAGARPWLEPLFFGGGQERGLRPGTLPTPLIVGFGVAAQLASGRLTGDALGLEKLCGRFRQRLATLGGVRFNDHPRYRVPGLVSVSIEGVEGESLLAALPELALSSGAACDSSSGEPSYVLRALGVPLEQARSTLRVSFGRDNTESEVELAAAAIRRAVDNLRSRDAPGAPAGTGWQVGEAGSIREGARVRCFLRMGSDGCIEALEFRAAACPHTEAVLGWLARRVLGLRANDPAIGTPLEWQRSCEVPAEKLGRLIVVEDAMRRALAASALQS